MDGDNTNLIVNYIPANLTEQGLQGIFSQFGTVESTKLITDKVTKKSLGYGFVKFSSEAEAQNAVASMNGTVMDNKTLRVKIAKPAEQKETTLYVAGLEPSWGEDQARAFFSSFGNVLDCKILPEKKGVGFLRFETLDEAKRAIVSLNGVQRPEFAKPLTVRIREKKSSNMQNGLGGMDMGYYGGPMRQQRGAQVNRFSPIAPMGMQYNYMAMQQQQRPMDMYGQQWPNQAFAFQGGVQDFGGASLFVYNIPPDSDDAYLYQLFAPFGAVSQIKVVTDPATMRCKGYAFVKMMKTEEAEMAIARLNGAAIGDKFLQVSFKKDK